ncbi:eukaryotic translation initiation factor 3 subunit B, putative [Plasmodium vinckei vinckei]|uniref:Eukaryotic translation initiation factor 3 subunit B n=1 Tax=Plasmodium vinckei vinckei TaxID=54757 RepID=A0A449BWS9_PLAVN|nr:eukaryotic translation initiation factor 3 subunit B, putative [Plasmodium vinckei vinckei]KEG03642.1 translation initiation factor 3 subunit B [Plasmodium vinckei vinckei]VEV57935.1 eukaryotic translation initiation factor 3 subunit B, putative [Plasmodium vinckei vinckei]
MVKVEESELSDKELVDFLSDDSDDGNETLLNKKYAGKEALITLETKFPKIVTILGIPKVEEEKHSRLAEVLKKLFIRHLSAKISDSSIMNIKIHMPVDNEKKTKGICFVTFHDSFQANEAVKVLNKLKLDAKHLLTASKMDDIENIINRDERVMPINVVGFTREKIRWWLYDEKCREQFIVRYDSHFEVHWLDPLEKEPQLIYTTFKKNAPFSSVQWSNQGSYLVSFHNPGIALWGGDNFEKLIRLQHKSVKDISFSPNENYVLTWDGTPASLRNEKSICIWRVITGKLLRSFITPEYSPREKIFPHFLWSPDDKYIACIGKQKEVYIYELPSMLLLEDREKKRTPLKYSVVKEFDWSPVDNIVSIWIPETNNTPGTLILVEIPSRKELVSRKIYDVSQASIHWQSKGDYLCLKTTIVKKIGKKGKKEHTQLEIFRMREKNIPVDNIQIEGVKTKQFHWEESNSNRFALIVRDEATSRQQIRFYKILNKGTTRNVKWTSTFDINNQMNFMKWSPQGTFFILASLLSEGMLYFCFLNSNDEVEVIHKDEHLLVNSVAWSNCGRYLVTSVSNLSGISSSNYKEENSETGFYIWTFQGRCLMTVKKPSFYQFFFRPHPKSLFSDKLKIDIKNNLKDYSKKFDVIDEKIRNSKKNQLISERKNVENSFNEKLEKITKLFQSFKEYELFRRNWETFESQFEWEEKTVVIEHVLSVKQEIFA